LLKTHKLQGLRVYYSLLIVKIVINYSYQSFSYRLCTVFTYCTVLVVLVRITDSVTQFSLSLFISDFTVGITPLSNSNSRTLERSPLELSTLERSPLELSTLELSTPELSNRRLSISRTLVFVDWLFSSTLRLRG
jgi:hypothetical protein